MNNVKEFLSKLDSVVWTEGVNRAHNLKGILRDGSNLVDVDVNTRIEINNMSGNRTMPFTLTMYVKIDGSRVAFGDVRT